MDNKPRILLIEDEKGMVEAVRLRLEANGYEVMTSGDGEEGLIKARSEKPDLIILDVMLPTLDGLKVCRMLKFDENYNDIPVVMFTAKTQEEDVACGKEVGADAYVKKPFKSEELLKVIGDLLAKKNQPPSQNDTTASI
jgi:DNA-binding response OmpR family regulator